jgi:hypothetical protein
MIAPSADATAGRSSAVGTTASGVIDERPGDGGTVIALIGRWFVTPVGVAPRRIADTPIARELRQLYVWFIAVEVSLSTRPHTFGGRSICSKLLKRRRTEQQGLPALGWRPNRI